MKARYHVCHVGMLHVCPFQIAVDNSIALIAQQPCLTSCSWLRSCKTAVIGKQ